MIRKSRLFFALLLLSAAMVWIDGCKEDDPIFPLEPISLVEPDTAISRKFPGDSLPLEIQFTTDRPINWVKGMYDLHPYDTAAYTPTYPDTLFFVRLDTADPRVNLYTYKGVYFVPDTLNPYAKIRFRISFEAGKSTFTVGQNYPKGIVTSTKEFRVDVR